MSVTLYTAKCVKPDLLNVGEYPTNRGGEGFIKAGIQIILYISVLYLYVLKLYLSYMSKGGSRISEMLRSGMAKIKLSHVMVCDLVR